MPARSQITRHDCVEGWSAIGKWTGVPLGASARTGRGCGRRRATSCFHCADDFRGTPYYESIDLVDAFHPQTILAYGMNDADLPVGHGAPLRLRVERQLGYKHAKFVMRIEAVASLAGIGRRQGRLLGGRGGLRLVRGDLISVRVGVQRSGDPLTFAMHTSCTTMHSAYAQLLTICCTRITSTSWLTRKRP